MSAEDVASESYTAGEDAEKSGSVASGRDEDQSAPAGKSERDEGVDEARSPTQDSGVEATPGFPDGSRAGSRAEGAAPAPGSAGTSSWKKEKKKKGRGGADGKPAMSIEDLFVTISTVQVGARGTFISTVHAVHVANARISCM